MSNFFDQFDATEEQTEGTGTAILRTIKNTPDRLERNLLGRPIQALGETLGFEALSEHAKGRNRYLDQKLEINRPKPAAGLPQYAVDITRGAIDMVPSLVGKSAGSVIAGLQSGSEEYAQSRADGESPLGSLKDALVIGGIETLTERIPLARALEGSASLLKRIAGTTMAEGAQEALVEVFGQIYSNSDDKGMSLADAISEVEGNPIAYSALVGAGVGGAMGTIGGIGANREGEAAAPEIQLETGSPTDASIMPSEGTVLSSADLGMDIQQSMVEKTPPPPAQVQSEPDPINQEIIDPNVERSESIPKSENLGAIQGDAADFVMPKAPYLHTDKSPKVKPGFTRLYRGEHAEHDRDVFESNDDNDGLVGGWFTDNEKYADYFKETQAQGSKRKDGARKVYVDVPTERLADYAVAGSDIEAADPKLRSGERSYFLPEFRGQDVIEPQSDRPVENIDNTPGGSPVTVYTPQGEPLQAHYQIVELDDLITSHDANGVANPNYDQSLQPRDRSKAASRMQVRKIAGNLNFDLLAESPMSDAGAPIVGPDGIVESGNGRTIALQLAYKNGEQVEPYIRRLYERAEDFGITPETLSGFERPVLVRVRDTEVDRKAFAEASNKAGIAAQSPAELANQDSDLIDVTAMGSEDIQAASNREFVKSFINKLPSTESAGLIDTKGRPTRQAYDRVASALFSKAYGSDRLIKMQSEEADIDVRNLLSSLTTAAHSFAQAREADPGRSGEVLADVVAAAEVVKAAKDQGMKVEEFVKQESMFDGPSDFAKTLAVTIAQNNRSPKRLGIMFKTMGDLIRDDAVRSRTGDMLGGERLTNKEIISETNRRTRKEYGEKAPQIDGGEQSAVAQVDSNSEPGTDGGAESESAGLFGVAEKVNEEQLSLFGGKPRESTRQKEASKPTSGTQLLLPIQSKAEIKKNPKEAANRVVDRLRKPPYKILANKMVKQWDDKSYMSLVGQTVKTPQALGMLAQVYRNPSFETFRVFFVKDGVVVGQTGLTNREPGAVSMPYDFANDIERQKGALKADGYYISHNHPSGNPSPSKADLEYTKSLARVVDDFMGHVVVDTTKYTVIDKNGSHSQFDVGEFQTPNYDPADQSTWSVKNKAVTEREKMTTADLAQRAMWISENPEESFHIIGTTRGIQGIAEIPYSSLEKLSRKRLVANLQSFKRQTASASVHIIADKNKVPLNAQNLIGLSQLSGLSSMVIDYEGRPIDFTNGRRKRTNKKLKHHMPILVRTENDGPVPAMNPRTGKIDGEGSQSKLMEEEQREMFSTEPVKGNDSPKLHDTSKLKKQSQKEKPQKPKQLYLMEETHAYQTLTPAQRAVVDTKFGTPAKDIGQSIKDWVSSIWDTRALIARQAIVDRYAALRKLDELALDDKDVVKNSIQRSSWVLARMSSAATQATDAMVVAGRIRLSDDKVIEHIPKSKSLTDVLGSLGDTGEINRFLQWIAGNRAAQLYQEGRERLFSEADIKNMLAFDQGKLEDGRNRQSVYADTLKDFNRFRMDVLEIGKESGVIDAEWAEAWANDAMYVPFYRVMEDAGSPHLGGDLVSPTEAMKRLGGDKLSPKNPIHKLKGSKRNLNDLLENTLRNYETILSQSLKNIAVTQAVENAELAGIAEKTDKGGPDRIAFFENGKRQYRKIGLGDNSLMNKREASLVLEAINMTMTPPVPPAWMKVPNQFKRLLTDLVTVMPSFGIANTFRDTLAVTATSQVKKNFAKNFAQGVKAYGIGLKTTETRAAMMASGAAFGNRYDNTERAKIILTAKDANRVWAKVRRNTAGRYMQVLNSAENVNRAAAYEQTLNRTGGNKLAAAFEARDVVDFSAHGASPVVRLMIQAVPFLNARIQGLDKLYRDGIKPTALRNTELRKQQARRFSAIIGTMGLATLMLNLINADDEEIERLPEYHKDMYWTVRVGPKQLVHLPKPFEVGAMATAMERMAEYAFSDDPRAGKVLRNSLASMFFNTFSFNPTPQIAAPVLEVKNNRDSFRGSPIARPWEMKTTSPYLWGRDNSSQWAQATSQALHDAGINSKYTSPPALDHYVEGYLASVGGILLAATDHVSNMLSGVDNDPIHIRKIEPFRRFFTDTDDPKSTRYSNEFYDALKSMTLAEGDYRKLARSPSPKDRLRAQQLVKEKGSEIAASSKFSTIQKRIAKINKRLKQITSDPKLTGPERERQTVELKKRKNELFKMGSDAHAEFLRGG